MNTIEALKSLVTRHKKPQTENPVTITEEKPPALIESKTLNLTDSQKSNIVYFPDKGIEPIKPIGIYFLKAFDEWLIFGSDPELEEALRKQGIQLYHGHRFGRHVVITQNERIGDSIRCAWKEYKFGEYDPNHVDSTRCMCGGEIWKSDMFCHECYTWYGEE